jgi:hypothetical protein
MRTHAGRVAEIQLEGSGGRSALLDCPAKAVPRPGQYLLALDEESLLGAPLFSAGATAAGFRAAPPVPLAWQPGTRLALRGPLGRGFRLPGDLRRLGLAAAGDTLARLLPLAEQALARDAAVTLFSDARLPPLPTSLEAYPLSALPEAYNWADFLALDLPLDSLAALPAILGLPPGARLPCPGQVLIAAPMPCAGLADCGVCALPAGRSWQLACQDGPVFEIKDVMRET